MHQGSRGAGVDCRREVLTSAVLGLITRVSGSGLRGNSRAPGNLSILEDVCGWAAAGEDTSRLIGVVLAISITDGGVV